MRGIISLFIAIIMLTGCNQSKAMNAQQSQNETTIGNPTAKEVLAQNPSVDVFQYKDIVYMNASDIEWVQQAELTIGERVGTITKQYKEDLTFEQGMATKLPVETEIYEPLEAKGSILIVKLKDDEVRYLGLFEG
ncbi:hypothetical protein [Paenibacillus endoradicis]|uniref:hypothetical protein n=1 Tax=Paenibacillus endoradicis TaxID=2972487 RepID=UPI0021599040|nr:hypothetical protein [Paenibacillus endoradicis]MCR8656767.1 hypothetical protein [Paenibacillus endoradicis]